MDNTQTLYHTIRPHDEEINTYFLLLQELDMLTDEIYFKSHMSTHLITYTDKPTKKHFEGFPENRLY